MIGRSLIALLLVSACAHTDQQPLRVLVYNIHAGKDAGGADNLDRVASLIAETQADIVLLQEVDRKTARSGGVDHLDVLMKRTAMHGAFGKSLDYQGGEYGIAVLSRWPVTTRRVVPLRVDPPQPRAGGSVEPRVALIVETNGRTIVNTHLDASRQDTFRLQEATELLRALPRNAFAGGDFNAEPDSAVHARLTAAGLRDAWAVCGEGDPLTFPAARPVKRIDYLFLPPGGTCTEAKVLASDASDHRPLLVVLAH